MWLIFFLNKKEKKRYNLININPLWVLTLVYLVHIKYNYLQKILMKLKKNLEHNKYY